MDETEVKEVAREVVYAELRRLATELYRHHEKGQHLLGTEALAKILEDAGR